MEEEMSDWSEGTVDNLFQSMDSYEVDRNSPVTDSEEETLADLQRRTRKQTQENFHENSDDSFVDKDYVPSKEDMNSSDSEVESQKSKEIVNTVRKGQKPKTIKRKLFKASPELKEKIRKRQAINQKRRKPISVQERKALEYAKQKSKRLFSLKQLVRNHHIKRLDNLLASNGLHRIQVPADGDCFFASVLHQLEDKSSVAVLRSKIADHLESNGIHYINFLADNESSEDRMDQYMREVSLIREMGHWKSDMSDAIPLAVANMQKRQIKIFSSDIRNPVYDITLTLTDFDQTSYINLAYLKVRDEVHYDGVTTHLDRSFSHQQEETRTPQKPKKAQPEVVTPHKDAVYITPDKKVCTRKRKSNPIMWKRNIRKQNRSCGLPYISQRGKPIPERSMKNKDCSNCKFHCSQSIAEPDRRRIFESFWGLGNFERQRDFICQTVQSNIPKRVITGRKKKSLMYHFSCGQKTVRVCKQFYISTLGIGKKTVDSALKQNICGTFTGGDRRGKRTPTNKTPRESVGLVCEHIESFPTMESHYVRKQSKRKYLARDLNITKMWELYKEKCVTNGKKPVSQSTYRQIFCEKYNYSFFKPKKDQCSQCTRFALKQATESLDSNLKDIQEAHLRRKQESREEKSKDKTRAKVDKTFYSATFDLQAVLSTPCTLVGELYYKRKLACYNLSFYSLGDENGRCYVWDETQGGRGSCEVGTCLITHINSIAGSMAGVKEITLYSDTCGGQNRNKHVVAAFLYAINKENNIQTINHKFFEPGHSQMESDSIHAQVENAKKKTVVYVPSQWNTVISLSRKKKPYVVIPMKYTDFLNLKGFSKQNCPNMKMSTKGTRVNSLKVVWIQIKKTHPLSVFLNETFDPSKFLEIKVAVSTRSQNFLQQIPSNLDARYSKKLPISKNKKNDLLSLCKSGLIPQEFHSYYEQLPCTEKKSDCIPMPVLSDSEFDTDDE